MTTVKERIIRRRTVMLAHVRYGPHGVPGHSVQPRVELELVRDSARVHQMEPRVLVRIQNKRRVNHPTDRVPRGHPGLSGRPAPPRVDLADRHVRDSARENSRRLTFSYPTMI